MTRVEAKYDKFIEEEPSKFIKAKFKGPFKKFMTDASPLRTAKRTLEE